MPGITPCPKPKPKRKGLAVQRSKSVAQTVRDRDGICLYGLVFKDGCFEGYDVAHIHSWGGHGQESDVLENMLCLCRKHHRLHEDGFISDITLQLVLYNFHGYGPEGALLWYLEHIRDIAKDYGLSVRFESKDGAIVSCYFTGTWRRIDYAFSMLLLDSIRDRDMLLEMTRSHIIRALRQDAGE